jgi:hypothetical protein
VLSYRHFWPSYTNILQELKIYDIACSVVDSIARLQLIKSAQLEDLNPREVLNRLQNILSSYRGGNITLLEQITSRLARMQNEPQVFPENEEEQDIPRDYGGRRRHSEQPAAFVSSTQVGHDGHDQDHIMGSFPTAVLDPYSRSPDHLQVNQHISFPWDYTAEETQANFGSNVEQMEESVAFDRFLQETMGDTNRLIARV